MSLTDGPYFHSKAKKADAEESLTANDGASNNGKFLFRKKAEGAILSVIYKSAPTHHNIAVGEAGDLTINKSPTGAANLVELEEFLRTKRKFWPVALTDGVPAGGGSPEKVAPKKLSTGGSGTIDSSNYHKALGKAAAEDLLLANGGDAVSGKYLIRKKAKTENAYILSVIYKGAPTHHNIECPADGGELSLNKTPTGCTSLSELEKKYTTKQPKWPVPLTEGVSSGSAGTGVGSSNSPSKPTPKKAASKPEPAAESIMSDGGDGDGDGDGEYFHGVITKSKSEELLLADGGAEKTGKFLFRAKKGAEDTSFILSVVYKGAPTHHMVVRDAPGSEFSLNKTPTGKNTLIALHEYLKSKQPKWPVPLKLGVKAKGKGKAQPQSSAPAPASEAAAPAQKTAASSSDPHTPYFFPGLKKDAADELLLADNGASESGKFLFRGKSPKQAFVSVIYKGKSTHHSVVMEGKKYLLNKGPIPCKTLAEVQKYLSKKQSKWPVPLTKGVTNPDRARSGGDAEPTATLAVATAAKPNSPVVTEYIEVTETIEVEEEVEVTDDEASGEGGVDGPESDDDFKHNLKKINKAKAEELLLADGGAEKSGKYLFRMKPKAPGEYLLGVVYKGAATHHAVAKVDGSFTLNKNPTQQTSLYDLAAWLTQKRPKWPVPLKEGVVRPGYKGGGQGKMYKKVKKMVKKTVTKKVPKSTGGWQAPSRPTSPDGPLGFDDWVDPNDEAQRLAALRGPVGKVEKRNWITKTWRRKKLESLEDKPNNFGAWGNLLSADQVKDMGANNTMPVSGQKAKRPSIFQNDIDGQNTLSIGLSRPSQARMQTSFMSFDAQSLGPESPGTSTEITQECTYLGNCTCPNCA